MAIFSPDPERDEDRGEEPTGDRFFGDIPTAGSCEFGCGPVDRGASHAEEGAFVVVTACPVHGHIDYSKPRGAVSQSLPNLTIEAQADLLRRILTESEVTLDFFTEARECVLKGVLVLDGAVFLTESDITLVNLLLSTSTARDDTATANTRDDTTLDSPVVH